MTATPQIPGYEFDQRLLAQPLAEMWRGRSFTGMQIVALILSDAGAASAEVRERLHRASRLAALEPGAQETPLWAANFNAARPYAITQLVPGQSGAERLIDPLDGVLGNDQESLDAVRSQLAKYGAAPLPPAEPAADHVAAPGTAAEPAGWLGLRNEYRRRLGGWIYLVLCVGVLIVFSVMYSIGGVISSAVKDPKPAITQGPAPTPVSPGLLPSPALLPAVVKAQTVPYNPTAAQVSLVGATYPRHADIQLADGLGLPFSFGWPRPPFSIDLGESSYSIYRRVLTGENPATASVDARIAVHPCRDLAACLTGRAEFDRQWTTYFKAAVPRTAKDDRTWITVQPAGSKPYALTMTHAFRSGDRWWLVGVMVTGRPGEEPAVQRVVNDIRSQTP